MKLRNRFRIAKLKKYFTEKPKSDFWKSAFIYLVIFKYISPMIVYLSLFMMVGLAAPEADITSAADIGSQAMANVFNNSVNIMFELGQGIAINNPILSKVILFAFANMVWVFYLGFIIMFLHMIRYLISGFIRKENKKGVEVK